MPTAVLKKIKSASFLLVLKQVKIMKQEMKKFNKLEEIEKFEIYKKAILDFAEYNPFKKSPLENKHCMTCTCFEDDE
ncbi:MAG: hypothetical protein Q7R52_03120 [archaeon]|nr:hypothetical protein [archaeon]